MTVLIEIHYISNDNKAMRRGSFPLKGKEREDIALEFWKWIIDEMPFGADLEKVICDGDEITEQVMELQKEDRKKKSDIAEDYLPF